MVRITAPHFCAGIEVGVRAAPILRWMLKLDLLEIFEYCAQKHWRAEIL